MILVQKSNNHTMCKVKKQAGNYKNKIYAGLISYFKYIIYWFTWPKLWKPNVKHKIWAFIFLIATIRRFNYYTKICSRNLIFVLQNGCILLVTIWPVTYRFDKGGKFVLQAWWHLLLINNLFNRALMYMREKYSFLYNYAFLIRI